MTRVDLQPPADAGSIELLERSDLLGVLERALASAKRGRGDMIMLAGEAGAGKTSLLRHFLAGRAGVRVLWGACERLFNPRALGPFLDIFETLGIELTRVSPHRRAPHDCVAALVAELPRKAPTVLVLEDLHWADEGTLDVVKLLARRIESLPALALVSFRDDQLAPADPLRMVLGELSGSTRVERLRIPRLSLEAVRALAEPHGVDAQRLFEKTAGNPFFVTEALAAPESAIPDTVRDAVLARAAPLAPAARRLLEAAAVVPAKIELWLLEAVAEEDWAHLDDCLATGMLRHEDGTVSFRHELARLAIEEAIAPHRRLPLHRSVLAALSGGERTGVDPARLVYHAGEAGDVEAVLRYAPAAGERAADLCAHRLAAQHFGRALEHGALLPPEQRARMYERHAYECYLTGQVNEAIEARRAALALYQAQGNRVREGDNHRWLSRLLWFNGDREGAMREARRAVEMLEAGPAGRELAMAYSTQAQMSMLASDSESAILSGQRAIELAERLRETETLVHALNNVGAAELHRSRRREGGAMLERSLAIAHDAELEEHVARAYTNLGAGSVRIRDLATADRNLAAGVAYCQEHDLDAWWLYMTGWMAYSHLIQGRWDMAVDHALAVLRHEDTAVASRITPLFVLGLVRARRGEPGTWPALDEALELARGTQELQRLGPVAAARAEARLLEGRADDVASETDAALSLALERSDRWIAGELCTWRRRAGIVDTVAPGSLPSPYSLELTGEWAAAARAWEKIGCPYEAALARAESGDAARKREALAALQRLGALPAARAIAQRLREQGITGVGRGPRRSTIEHPAQLTSRQVEILALLGDRLTNAEIAERLYISPKTVDHHVSAILGKLGVHSRRAAAAEAARLGVLT